MIYVIWEPFRKLAVAFKSITSQRTELQCVNWNVGLNFGVHFWHLRVAQMALGALMLHKGHSALTIMKPPQMCTGQIFHGSWKNETVIAFQLACLNVPHLIGDMFRLISVDDWLLIQTLLKIMWGNFFLLVMNSDKRVIIEEQVANVSQLKK